MKIAMKKAHPHSINHNSKQYTYVYSTYCVYYTHIYTYKYITDRVRECEEERESEWDGDMNVYGMRERQKMRIFTSKWNWSMSHEKKNYTLLTVLCCVFFSSAFGRRAECEKKWRKERKKNCCININTIQ